MSKAKRVAERRECGGTIIESSKPPKRPESPHSPKKQLSARKALEVWGLWTVSGRFKSAGEQSDGGGEPGFDEGLAVSVHLEKFFRFHLYCRKIMLAVHGHGQEPEEYSWLRPGKSVFTSASLEGWLAFADVKQSSIPRAVYNHGVGQFAKWYAANPVPGLHRRLVDEFEPIVEENAEKVEKEGTSRSS